MRRFDESTMRPLFLTRTQRLAIRLRPLFQVLFLAALFAFLGVLLAWRG
jgi:hypothetical protein